MEEELILATDTTTEDDGESKNKSFESLSSLTSDVSDKVGTVGQSVKTNVQVTFLSYCKASRKGYMCDNYFFKYFLPFFLFRKFLEGSQT